MTPLLDTCAALWLMGGEDFSPETQARLREALGSDRVMISPITAWEVGLLVQRGRVSLSADPVLWFRTLLKLPGCTLAEISPEVLIASTRLPGAPPRDPADRIIAATAREHGYRVITRNQQILDYAAAGHLQVAAC